jgi:hypothetical protein
VALFWTLASALPAQEAGIEPVYRIVILQNLSLQDAQRLKSLLEELDYRPVYLDRQGERYRVLHGAFSSQQQARQALARLEADALTAKEIVRLDRISPPPDAAPTGGFSVFVAQFGSEADARRLMDRLRNDPAGYPAIRSHRNGNVYRVYAGNTTIGDASRLLDQLKAGGYTTDNVSQVSLAPEAMDRTAPPVEDLPPPPISPEQQPDVDARAALVSTAMMQTDLWKSLTEDQKRKVITEAELISSIRVQGDPVAQQVFDLNKRFDSLSEDVKSLVTMIQEEDQKERDVAKDVDEIVNQAENFARSKDYENAIVWMRKALEADPDNILRQRSSVQRRIGAFEGMLSGEHYEGQAEEIDRKKQEYERQIEQLRRAGGIDNMQRALNLWYNIRLLDPERYANVADPAIADLTNRIKQAKDQEAADMEAQDRRSLIWIYGLVLAVGLLFLLVLFTLVRTRSQQKELVSRLHDITSASIRPMRELEGSHTPLLDTGGGTESDIFSSRAPLPGKGATAAIEEPADDGFPGDPLGGVATASPPEKKRKDKKGKAKAEPEAAPAPASGGFDELDELFGDSMGSGDPEPSAPAADSAKSHQHAASPDDMDFDALFSGGSDGPAEAPSAGSALTNPQEAGPTEASQPDIDVFGGLFGEADQPAESIEPAAATSTSMGPISFDNGSPNAAAPPNQASPSDATDDLLAIFDSVAGGDPGVEKTAVTGGVADDRFKDSPFADILDDASSSTQESSQAVSSFGGEQDSTEIPSIRIEDNDLPGASSTAIDVGLGSSAFGNAETSGLDLDAFSGAAAQSNGAVGVEQDFEDEEVGGRPAGWDGDYPFASLTVQADTPPRGGHQYLCFTKQEGAGKALFSRRFPEVAGVVGIEFDMRCNDKNKFLLGIYVEKDGDFQQAVHTKILRSEAQTTPTIHMQGESAPYLLGSWAHIKYVVDLPKGTLNSYIDNTHVGRDVPLEPNPGTLNTLSIRDNINTTGTLLLDNIKVYPLS